MSEIRPRIPGCCVSGLILKRAETVLVALLAANILTGFESPRKDRPDRDSHTASFTTPIITSQYFLGVRTLDPSTLRMFGSILPEIEPGQMPNRTVQRRPVSAGQLWLTTQAGATSFCTKARPRRSWAGTTAACLFTMQAKTDGCSSTSRAVPSPVTASLTGDSHSNTILKMTFSLPQSWGL